MTEVVFDHVTKVFPGPMVAVDDLSFEVGDGEFLILVGPSGCGKTTALRMVAGLEKISTGTIAVGDGVINDVPPKDRDIAMVFQNYALYPHMTVEKNLGFAPAAAQDARRTRSAQRVRRDGRDARAGRAAASGGPGSYPAGSGNGWRWGGHSFASRRCSCWTSRCRTSTRSSGCRCAPS